VGGGAVGGGGGSRSLSESGTSDALNDPTGCIGVGGGLDLGQDSDGYRRGASGERRLGRAGEAAAGCPTAGASEGLDGAGEVGKASPGALPVEVLNRRAGAGYFPGEGSDGSGRPRGG
jgi:hypothetical protein